MPNPQPPDIAGQFRTTPPMVVLRAGDRVLIALTEDPEPEETQHIAAGLRTAFPGVDFTILTGVASIAVSGGSNSWPLDTEPPTGA